MDQHAETSSEPPLQVPHRHKPWGPRRIGFGLLSAKSTQFHQTCKVPNLSVTFAPTTFKRSQTVGSDCKVIQQELRVFHKPGIDRRGADQQDPVEVFSCWLLPTAPCACFHSVGLLRSANPPSSEVTVSAMEASGSACNTPKVLPVSSMKRRSSPSAYTERPLWGDNTSKCKSGHHITNVENRDGSFNLWISEEAVIALKHRLLQPKLLRMILS